MEINEIKEIIKLFSSSNVDQLEIDKEGLSLKLGKDKTSVVSAPVEVVVPTAAAVSSPVAPPEDAEDTDLFIVTSPIVGTYYRAPSPDADPFVDVGSRVKKGQTLCIVEAMKLMNEIQAEQSGEVVKFFADNGEGVEYGQPLIGIKVG